jgi:bifunctional non-homologous end joining protein LigD
MAFAIKLDARHHLRAIANNCDGSSGAICLSEEAGADGAALLDASCEHGVEGIIAKDMHGLYRPGCGGDCCKIKCLHSESFIIVGYEHATSARAGIGSLLLSRR